MIGWWLKGWLSLGYTMLQCYTLILHLPLFSYERQWLSIINGYIMGIAVGSIWAVWPTRYWLLKQEHDNMEWFSKWFSLWNMLCFSGRHACHALTSVEVVKESTNSFLLIHPQVGGAVPLPIYPNRWGVVITHPETDGPWHYSHQWTTPMAPTCCLGLLPAALTDVRGSPGLRT